jgi:hypothetical protein
MLRRTGWGWGVLAVLAWVGVAGAAQTNYDIGKVGGSELKIGLGPRPVAMGEAFVGLADDLNTTAWNPAGLAQMKGYQAGFMHNIYLQETSQEYLAYAQNLFEGAGLGVNLTYFNYGSLEKINDVGGFPQMTGQSFTPTVLTASVGYGQWLGQSLALGAAVKFLSQHIDTESYSAVAADLGALFKPGVDGLQIGLAVQNLGTQLAQSSLPMNAKVGLGYLVPAKFGDKDIWNAVLDVNVPFGDTKYLSVNVGTEYWISGAVAARVGYKVKDTGDLGGVTGLTAGLGIKLSMFNLDYAMVSFGDLGLSHQLALTVSFE